MTRDPFEILGVAPGATDAEVQRAWRRVSKRVHPDVGGSAEEFRAAFEAYDLLRSRGASSARDEVAAWDYEWAVDLAGGSHVPNSWAGRPPRTISMIVAMAMAILIMVMMLFAPAVLVLQR